MKSTTVFGMAAALLTCTALVAPANAKTFTFTLTSTGGDIGSGQIIATGSGTTYVANGISGIINGSAITGLSPFAAADQQLFLAPTHFSFGGLSFASTVGIAYNLTNFPGGTDHITNSVYDPNGDGNPTPFALDFAITAVPEPAAWAMMIGGFGAVGFALRRREKVRIAYA